MIETVGQVNRGSKLGEIIYNLCLQDDVKNIVEIGTWNGMGSTKCIYDSIIDSNKIDYKVYSLESNSNFHKIAINNLPKLKNFEIILGRIIETNELFDIDSYPDFFFNNGSDRNVQRTWLEEDLSNYNKIPNVIDQLPEKIDLLILDGGEFSSFSEFKKLEDRVKYLILDDTKIIKNYEVSKIVRSDNRYTIIMDSDDRNGFLIAKKNN